MPKIKHISALLLIGSLLGSCTYTKYVPKGKYILWDQDIQLKGDASSSSRAENILKQEPNQSIFGLRPALSVYNWGDGTDSSFFGNIGKAPVIFDSVKTSRGAQQLKNYFFNQGYFRVKGNYTVEIRGQSKQKASVVYQIKPGPRYRIDSISYDINTPALARLVKNNAKGSNLKVGMYYEAQALDAERTRLKDLFLNQGYFNFSKNFIRYRVDTVSPGKPLSTHVTMVIADRTKRVGDSVIQENHRTYQIDKVFIKPDFAFLDDYRPVDTTTFQDYQVVYEELQYQPRYLTDAIHFREGETYRYREVKETYNHLASYNAFDINEVSFEVLEEPDSGQGRLKALVRLKPRPKFTLNNNLEVTNTSNNYGISGSVGVINRNLFKAGEALRFDINSALEYQPTLGNANNLSRTFELGAELAIDFPRFLVPFNSVGLVPKRMQPESSVSLFANRTSRAEFQRETFGSALQYRWRESELKIHEVELLKISYANYFDIPESFSDQLNPIQLIAFSSEFISSTTWNFTYSGQSLENRNTYNFFSSELEVAGTLQSLLANNYGEERNNGRTYLWGAPTFQFTKAETDYRHYWRIDQEHTWVQRFLAGYVFPYGNSYLNDQARFPPFSRFFFLGGSNDLRAWPAYRAGGGTARITDYQNTSTGNGFSIGTLKLLFNSEYRFPIYYALKGAVFLDAGNIWLTGGLEDNLLFTGFAFNRLLNDLYLGSGLGLRLDLDFFVIRFDTGLKIRDPGYLRAGEEWVIATKPVFPNLTYNIALGYPF